VGPAWQRVVRASAPRGLRRERGRVSWAGVGRPGWVGLKVWAGLGFLIFLSIFYLLSQFKT
jgi:hypothetical protein